MRAWGNAALSVAQSLVAAAPRVLYRSTLSLVVDPLGSQRLFHDVLNGIDLRDDDPVLGSVAITDLLPGSGNVTLTGDYYRQDSGLTQSLLELSSLAWIVQSTRPDLTMEFGTFEGRTTKVLAQHSRTVVTIDINAQAARRVADLPNVVALTGDSRTIDLSRWHGAADFVLVDGGHDVDVAAADTASALRLSRPGGWIAWHDYRHTAFWSGVTRAVRALRPRLQPMHLRGTTIAVVRNHTATS